MQKNRLSRILLALVILAILTLLGYCIYQIWSIRSDTQKTLDVQNETKLVETNDWEYMDAWVDQNLSNPDFVGWIKFDSDLINLPVVQASDEFYLRHNIYGDYDECGTVFIEPYQDQNQRNVTIYGHYVYADDQAMFTPLEKLCEPENYESNKTFSLYLANEIRRYEIFSVVNYDVTRRDWNFAQDSYDEKDLKEFIDYANINRMYPTGLVCTPNDNFVTLQTCVRNHQNLRTVVVAKEIERIFK